MLMWPKLVEFPVGLQFSIFTIHYRIDWPIKQ